MKNFAAQCIKDYSLEGALITLSKDGVFVAFEQEDEIKSDRFEAEEREVFDVTGAGDTVIATFSLFLSAGLTIFDSARWANRAAGVVVGKSGAATVNRNELIRYAERFLPWQQKIQSLDELIPLVQESKKKGHRVVFTNGCFDLFHVGHIQLLQKAKALGDQLIVAVNSYTSVRKLKGSGRPLSPQRERLHVLSSLDCVDQLVVYDDATPHRLLEELQPDILVKGGNYSPEEVTGHEIVESYGGRVEIVPIESEISISGLVDNIVKIYGKGESESL